MNINNLSLTAYQSYVRYAIYNESVPISDLKNLFNKVPEMFENWEDEDVYLIKEDGRDYGALIPRDKASYLLVLTAGVDSMKNWHAQAKYSLNAYKEEDALAGGRFSHLPEVMTNEEYVVWKKTA